MDEVDHHLDRGLYVSHHRAGGASWVVIVPPLYEEQARTRKVLVTLARELAAKGHDVVRFDYYGTGLSHGHAQDFSPSGAHADLEAVISYCRAKGAERVSLLGFRYGGHLALSSLFEPRDDIARVVVWEPITDLGAYFDELLRQELANQVVSLGGAQFTKAELLERLRARGHLLVEGYRVTERAHQELAAARTIEPAALREHAGRVALLFWDRKKTHAAFAACGLDAQWLAEIRFSWRHIRYLQPRAGELFDRTAAALAPRAHANHAVHQ